VQGGIIAALITALLIWVLYPVAYRWGLLDMPGGRKAHARPTPYIGGIAILAGVAAVLATGPDPGRYLGFGIGCCLLAGVGVLDDKYDVRWYWRVLVQVMATLAMVYFDGIRVEQFGPALGLGAGSLGALSVPFTVVATVGLINAVNMVDGMDGAAGTLVATALLLLVGAAWYSGNFPVAQCAVLLLGGVLAFLAYNLRYPGQPQARCFLGNAGSALLGFALAWLSFRLTQNAAHPVSPVLALWFVPIPVMDTLVLMVRRLRNRRSPFCADRNHIHHLVEAAGVGPTRACLLLSAITLGCGMAVAQALRSDVPEPLLLGAFGLMCLGWYLLTRSRPRAIACIASVLQTAHARPLPLHAAGEHRVAPPTRIIARRGGTVDIGVTGRVRVRYDQLAGDAARVPARIRDSGSSARSRLPASPR
jgi:UDP-GlcNAc:undecaprenyl-phosphate GlcNAc-1-phosphate transferase